MFSYFRGSSTTTNSDNTATASAAPTEGSVKTPTNRPTAGAAYGGNDLPQEDARYADMVLLPNRRANEDTLMIRFISPARNRSNNSCVVKK